MGAIIVVFSLTLGVLWAVIHKMIDNKKNL